MTEQPGAEAPATAAVLIIGDEILSGRTADINLNAIARFLVPLGVDLKEARVVADVTADIVDAVNALRSRYDYVFTTGGIGPTHDDITADAVAEAFGVALYEHPDIIALLKARPGLELNAARRRMARVPEGGSLIRNPGGPPGFQIGNVFVMAGVPGIMRGMLEDVPHRLRIGAPVVSRTIRIDGSGEGVVAAPLEAVQKAHPALSLGSYPFFSNEGFGTNLVVRGRDVAEVEATLEELTAALRGVGVERITPA
jgi:molybdenum cofactor synthesis domain-containing protein